MWSKASKFDVVYRKLLLTNFFTKGWGSPDTLRRIFELGRILSDRSICHELVDDNYPITIDKDEEKKGCRIVMGHFHSPFAKLLPDIMPQEVQTARFQLVLPLVWPKHGKPVCIHLAGTGDHHFWRRRVLLARPLIKEYGIGSLLLENPYYGHRKPKDQLHSSLQNVSDLFVMGGALILESLTLLHWCEKQGYGPLALSGVSMGGHMATLAATNWHKPIPLIPCLSWSSATPVFTDGVLSGAIPWNLLATQYICHHEYEADILKKLLKCPQTDAFKLGQEFASNYPESAENLHNVQFRKGLANLHDDDAKKMPSNSIRPSHNNSVCSEDLVSKTNNIQSCTTNDENTNEIGANSCNESKTNPANYSRITKHVLSDTSTSATTVDVSFKEPIPTVHPKESRLFHTNGIHNSYTHHGLNFDRTMIDRLGLNTKNPGLTTSDISSKHNEHDQKSLIRSKLQNDLLKETSNIPVIDSLDGQPEYFSELNLSKTGIFANKATYTRNTKIKGQPKPKVMKSKDIKKLELVSVKEEALNFMHGVMDVCTFVGNFSTPLDTSLVIVIAAEMDAYMPRDKMPSLQDLWPGIEVRYLNSGHVRAILFKQHHFRKAINDAITKYMIKYPEEY